MEGAASEAGGSATWTERVCLLDDEPLSGAETASHELSRLAHTVVRSFMRTPSSMIIHVDGTWGRGKTSFCKIVERAISARDDATVSWYIASDETAPAWDAVLSAIARALTNNRDPEEVTRIVEKWGTGGDPLGDPLQGLRDFLSRELGHATVMARSDSADMHVAAPMFHPKTPDGTSKDAEATHTVPRWEVKFDKPSSRMLVVIVDDIDRCRTDHVVAVFDAVRAFATCPGLKFIMSADRHLLEAASAHIVERLGASDVRTADDALKKYIRHRVELPRFSDLRTELMSQMQALESKLLSGPDRSLLGGPRDLHSGVGFLLARVFDRSLTMRELKRTLNALADPLSRGAEQAQLAPGELDDYWAEIAKAERPAAGPIFFKSNLTQDDYAAFHLGTLLWTSAQHLWPELVDGCEGNSVQVQERFRTLATVSMAFDFWDERRLDDVLEHLFPHPPERASSPKQVRRAFCDWVRRLYWSFKLHDFAPPPLEGAVEATAPALEDVEQEPDVTFADTADLDDLWKYLAELQSVDDRWLAALTVWLYEAGRHADTKTVAGLMDAALDMLRKDPDRMSAEYATACASALDHRGLTREAHDLLLLLAGSRDTPRWVNALPLLGDMARRDPITREGLVATLGCFQTYLAQHEEGLVDAEPRLAGAYWRLRSERPIEFVEGDAAFEKFTRAHIGSPAGAYAALKCDALLNDDGALRQIIHIAQEANKLERWVRSLRVELADYLARRTEQAHWMTARSLLQSIPENARSLYTLGVIEQRLSEDKATDRVAQLFERSYLEGHRSDELKQAFASVLRSRGDERRALRVETGEPIDEGDDHE